MSYKYDAEKHLIFTESGCKMLFQIRDNVQTLLAKAGAVRLQEAVAGVSGDSWTQLACVDYLVEAKELREITGPSVPGQYRVFVRANG